MAVPRTRRIYSGTTERIIMEGDAVHTVTETITKTVSLTDFMAACKAQGEISTPIMPNGTKFYRKKNERSVLVVEKPPQTRTITWKGMDMDPTKTRWKLSFPYTVFVFEIIDPLNINSARFFFRTKTIGDLTDMLYKSSLTNIYDTYKICTGYGPSGMRALGNTLSEKVDNYIAAFWHSDFNTDLAEYSWGVYAHDRLHKYPQLETLEAWQAATTANQFFTLNDIVWKEVYDLNHITTEIINNPNN